MESPTKERLTGGLIFVAALIIIVPEMFSGPDRAPATDATPAADASAGPQMRTYDMVLDRPAGQEPAQETLAPRPVAQTAAGQVSLAAEPVADAVAEAPAGPMPAEPAPDVVARETPAEPRRESPPPVAAPKPTAAAPGPPAISAPAPATAAPSGRWWVQLGRFSERENAERLALELRRAGYNISLSQIRADGKELTLVRAGPVADRTAATAMQKRLSAAGHSGSFLVPP